MSSPSRVVLPLPEGPMRAVISPGCRRPLTLCRSESLWRLFGVVPWTVYCKLLHAPACELLRPAQGYAAVSA